MEPQTMPQGTTERERRALKVAEDLHSLCRRHNVAIGDYVEIVDKEGLLATFEMVSGKIGFLSFAFDRQCFEAQLGDRSPVDDLKPFNDEDPPARLDEVKAEQDGAADVAEADEPTKEGKAPKKK